MLVWNVEEFSIVQAVRAGPQLPAGSWHPLAGGCPGDLFCAGFTYQTPECFSSCPCSASQLVVNNVWASGKNSV